MNPNHAHEKDACHTHFRIMANYHTSVVLERMKGTEILNQMLHFHLVGKHALNKPVFWFIP